MKTIFDYTLLSLWRFGWKNIFIAGIFALLVWLLSSVIFITSSIKYALLQTASNTPEIVINKQIAGKNLFILPNELEPLWDIMGVSLVKGRVWGQYKLKSNGHFITLLGIDPYGQSENINKIIQNFSQIEDNSYMYLSQNMLTLLSSYMLDKKTLVLEDIYNNEKKFKIAGIYKNESELFSNDVLMMKNEDVREMFGIEDGLFTDVILRVQNPNEINFIAAKIANKYPHFKLTTKDEILKDYELLYQHKSAWFLLLFFVSFITFTIILYDKVSGLRSEERKEIGILKALGWDINDIIYFKFLESSIISLGAFFIGLSLALFFVYTLQAPFLKYIFTGYSELKNDFALPFTFNGMQIALLFFSSVPFYIASCIVPAWKCASLDVGEIIK